MTSINRINPALNLGFLKVKIWRTVERTADFAAVESPAAQPYRCTICRNGIAWSRTGKRADCVCRECQKTKLP